MKKHDVKIDVGYTFKNKALLNQAFTVGFGDTSVGYERFEFLGDRVLGLVVAQMLFEQFPLEPEGDLARRFAFLTKAETLAKVANKLGFKEHVITSAKTDVTSAVLSDICEALIAAMYMDGGLNVAEAFIKKHWSSAMKLQINPPVDSKTKLQEWAQARKLPLPIYTVLERSGPHHCLEFTIQVSVDGCPDSVGKGASKKEASQNAAALMLKQVS